MTYERMVGQLEPTFHAPLDHVDFDGGVEDLVTFNLSEESDAEVLFESGIVNISRSLAIDSEIEFLDTIGSITSFGVCLSTPGDISQNILAFDDDSLGIDDVSVPGSWDSSVEFWYEPEEIDHAFTLAIDNYTSPAIPAGVWVHVVYNGTWFIDVLGPGPEVLAAQQFHTYDYTLSQQEVDDLRDIARLSHKRRQVLDNGMGVLDAGAEGLSANWHIVSV